MSLQVLAFLRSRVFQKREICSKLSATWQTNLFFVSKRHIYRISQLSAAPITTCSLLEITLSVLFSCKGFNPNDTSICTWCSITNIGKYHDVAIVVVIQNMGSNKIIYSDSLIQDNGSSCLVKNSGTLPTHWNCQLLHKGYLHLPVCPIHWSQPRWVLNSGMPLASYLCTNSLFWLLLAAVASSATTIRSPATEISRPLTEIWRRTGR